MVFLKGGLTPFYVGGGVIVAVGESWIKYAVGHVICLEGAGYAFTYVIVYTLPHAVFILPGF